MSRQVAGQAMELRATNPALAAQLTLATASGDHFVRLWETNVDGVTARICAITWSAITKSEWDHFLPDLAYRPPCP